MGGYALMDGVYRQNFFEATTIDEFRSKYMFGGKSIGGAQNTQDLAVRVGAGGLNCVLTVNPIGLLLFSTPTRGKFIRPPFDPTFTRASAMPPDLPPTRSLAPYHGTAYKAGLFIMQLRVELRG